ncbi:MAG: general substrate transporter [Lasallia pustulata]|uniref:General substrate transporter n=1 Tax=Lasallia pustulata TaxID=136370 RepID=A0A5M8PX45_9LECA|nr:MAG: general substrate transporter [Lasallia pustulata]
MEVPDVPGLKRPIMSKKHEIVLFSASAVALYGYDQGMMSLINTNYDYLQTMGIRGESPVVGIIVSVYYLGCAVGAVLFSYISDVRGRKPSIFACLATTAIGNLMMFVSGLGFHNGAMVLMFLGRIVMGLGVGGVDAVIPVYSSELSPEGGRGRALAQEFQANIFGLNMAFAINLGATNALGKSNQWAWRIPIVVMQVYPVLLLSFIYRLPESSRWLIYHDRHDDARTTLRTMYGDDKAENKLEDLIQAHHDESSKTVNYSDMLWPSGREFHPTVVTIMGQVNQALTGYGAVSVYGPQIFELLGFGVMMAEYLTQANYISYFIMMTLAWIYIDRVGRRALMVGGAFGISACFALLTLMGGLAMNNEQLGIPRLAVAIPGIVLLYLATGLFGIGWLTQPWLIPTEIYPSTARAQGSAISVIIWGIANFAVTLLSPIGFNNLDYWLFLIFAATNAFAGWWTWMYSPETGGRSFEENQGFFRDADEEKTWRVHKVGNGEFKGMPKPKKQNGNDTESTPLLGNSS